MRYIDLELIVGLADSAGPMDASETARKELLAANETTRPDLIKSGRSVWVSFRPVFESTFGQKCWYTESVNPGTDDDVDHFRPKGRLAEREDHGGYWWEALNWRNFRLSCHRANRLRRNPDSGQTHGKGDHFPILDEDHRWMTPESSCAEAPALLDPTDPGDPPLLTFDQDGTVALSPAFAGSESARVRVESSRIYLHLDWPQFVEDRRNLYAFVFTRVLDGDQAAESLGRGEVGARESLKTVARDLIRSTRESQPYSRAAIAYIRLFRDRDWLKRTVLPNIVDGSVNDE